MSPRPNPPWLVALIEAELAWWAEAREVWGDLLDD